MAILVNGVAIADAAVDAEVQYHPADNLEAARHEAATALVVRELLLQEAARLGLGAPGDDADEEALIRRLLEQEVALPDADAVAVRRYYDNNPLSFRSPELFEACHILFLADPEDEEQRATARRQAEETIGELVKNPERFDELARARSACPSKGQGGNLGQITRGQTVPEFESFLYALEPGQLSSVPVPTRFGFHVLRLDRRIEGQTLAFEAVADRIEAYLQQNSWQRAVHQYLQILAGRAVIEGITMDGAAASPLVQ